MYHANIFPLTRSDPIPVYEYTATITPTPVNRPQAYQILGGISKRITNSEKIPVIANQLSILSMNQSISSLGGYFYEIPEVGRFNVNLAEAGNGKVTIREFEAYSHLVNRLVDMALTMFAEDYYKFHPDSPYILRDEPYFDQDLISRTGILDAKRYYRGVHLFKDAPCFVLNRETQLRSNGNLLTEIRNLKNSFEETRGEKIDIDNPSQAFVDFINSLLRNKAAEVRRYPGPSVKRIKEVTWRYRAKDTTPGSSLSQTEYFRKTYGITGLDPLQPLVAYDIDNPKETRYQIPELLWIGHDFHDLERRIPKWRRHQVWGILHPDCKNQLTKIFEVLSKVNTVLNDKAPEMYPGIVEIATEPLDISESAARVSELKIAFGSKEIVVKHPFDTSFYHQYSRKPITFAKQVPETHMLVVTDHEISKLQEFVAGLKEEFERRNGSGLGVDYSTFGGWSKDLKGHDVILTIGDDSDSDDEYRRTKELIQNKVGVPHQHVTIAHADEDSVMPLVMQLTLKLGGDPWLRPNNETTKCVFGIHSYRNPDTQRGMVFALAMDSDGSIARQFDPVSPNDFQKLGEEIAEINLKRGRSVYLFSYDRFGLIPQMERILNSKGSNLEYCLAVADDQEYFRFFETWIPRKAPRFGKTKETRAKSDVEAYESAPEGLVVKASNDAYYLVTGRTIEKDSLRRGCPTPIRLVIARSQGNSWDNSQIARFVLSFCFMGRASGHLTRFPSPLYYLRLYAHYVHNYGLPEHANIRERPFYV